MTKKLLLTMLCLPTVGMAQMPAAAEQISLQQWSLRADSMARCYPQEKVYVHMDNTCYFVGDTIWFKAYTRQTDTDKSSAKSGVLYVELWNHDGYLQERKLVEMTGGEGHGHFCLRADSTLYSGFYELRAYTRWQLNWGEVARKQNGASKKWFFNKTMEYEFFRDYEKLYSRVFAVYDKAANPSEPELCMSERPKLRYYSTAPSEPKMQLHFYPEGGTLVEGLKCRVAFEATTSDGQCLEGELHTPSGKARAIDRGRGVIEIRPGEEMPAELTFCTTDGRQVTARLPQAEKVGATLSVEESKGRWHIAVRTTTPFPADSLALVVMRQGKLVHYATFAPGKAAEATLHEQALQAGVHQATIYDATGRVWADRLFFVRNASMARPTLTVAGKKASYKPHEAIHLSVQSQAGAGSTLSVAVRDGERGARNDDTANIMAEMLLSSEIRGFVPQPGWYFQSDDRHHRQALDLLMMVQGWRRFAWKDLTTPGHFLPVHPAEQTPYLFGSVHTYESATEKYTPQQEQVLREHLAFMGLGETSLGEDLIGDHVRRHFGYYDSDGSRLYQGKDLTSGMWKKYADTTGLTAEQYRRWKGDGERLKQDTRVHGVVEYGHRSLQLNAKPQDGQFRFRTPRLFGHYPLYLQASNFGRWTADEQADERQRYWGMASEHHSPEFYVRLSTPYPRFVQPYHFYQTTHHPQEQESTHAKSSIETTLRQVTVHASRGGLRRDGLARPVVRLDAYEAFNMAVDAGLMDPWYSSTVTLSRALARCLVADMGLEGDYRVVNRLDNIYGNETTQFYIGGENVNKFTERLNHLGQLDSIYIFTDYAPRLSGDKRYHGADRPAVSVLFKPGFRNAYRDRYVRLQGFAYPAECYSPDYSQHTPPAEQPDYRRTLYWNPMLPLDSTGTAHITLYNNSRHTRIHIDAQGQSPDGTLLWSEE